MKYLLLRGYYSLGGGRDFPETALPSFHTCLAPSVYLCFILICLLFFCVVVYCVFVVFCNVVAFCVFVVSCYVVVFCVALHPSQKLLIGFSAENVLSCCNLPIWYCIQSTSACFLSGKFLLLLLCWIPHVVAPPSHTGRGVALLD